MKSGIKWVKPTEIEVEEGFNVRYDYGDINGLKNSIAENGIKVPLRAYKKESNKYILTDGHRRNKAIQKLNEEGITIEVPIILDKKEISQQERVVSMVIHNDGKRFTLLEEGDAFSRLLEMGWNNTQIAKQVGKSLTHVANCLNLSKAPEPLKRKIKAGKVSSSFVADLLRNYTADEILEIIESSNTKGKRATSGSINTKPKITIRGLQELKETMETKGNFTMNQLKVIEDMVSYYKGELTMSKFLENE